MDAKFCTHCNYTNTENIRSDNCPQCGTFYQAIADISSAPEPHQNSDLQARQKQKIPPIILIRWIVGIVLFAIGTSYFNDQFFTALPLVLCGVIITPVAGHLIQKVFDKNSLIIEIPALLLMGLMVHFGAQLDAELQIRDKVASLRVSALEKQKKHETFLTELRAEFNSNRADILRKLKNNMLLEQYQEAKVIAKKYSALQEPEVEKALEEIEEAGRKNKIRSLLSQISVLDDTAYITLHRYYGELIDLDPTNQEYRSKRKLYGQKINDARQRIIDIEERIFPNGHPEKLVLYVKSKLYVPSTFSYSSRKWWDQGDHILVTMWYSADNRLGQSKSNVIKAKLDLNGRVLKILRSDEQTLAEVEYELFGR